MLRRVTTVQLAALLALLLTVGSLAATVPYVAYAPGPTFNTLGANDGVDVVTVAGRQTFPTEGHLDLTTVGVEPSITLGQAVVDWFRRDRAVVPREFVFPPGKTDAQVTQENDRQMTVSQDDATTAALTQLKVPLTVTVAAVTAGAPATGKLLPADVVTTVDGAAVTSPEQLRTLIGNRAPGASVRIGYRREAQNGEAVITTSASSESPPRPVIGVETGVGYPFEVKIALKDVGGPSAGMMFALAIVDKLTPGALTGGRYIAGTGEIAADGTVGPIGGIEQKLLGARHKGATVFLVPTANCAAAAASRPAGLQLVKVATLTDALTALQTLDSGGAPPGCTP